MVKRVCFAVLLAPAIVLAQAGTGTGSTGISPGVGTPRAPGSVGAPGAATPGVAGSAAMTPPPITVPACPPGSIPDTSATAGVGGTGAGGTGAVGTGVGTGIAGIAGTGTGGVTALSVRCRLVGATAPPARSTLPAGGQVPGSGSGNVGPVGGAGPAVPQPSP